MPTALAAALQGSSALHGGTGLLRLDWPSDAAASFEAPLLQAEVFAADAYFALGAHLPPHGAVVLDVGACVGQFALRCALASSAAHIVAIEPAPATAACLLRNLARALRRRRPAAADDDMEQEEDTAGSTEEAGGTRPDEMETERAASARPGKGREKIRQGLDRGKGDDETGMKDHPTDRDSAIGRSDVPPGVVRPRERRDTNHSQSQTPEAAPQGVIRLGEGGMESGPESPGSIAAAAAGESLLQPELWDQTIVQVARTARYTVVVAAAGRRPSNAAELEFDEATPGEATLYPSERATRRSITLNAAREWLRYLARRGSSDVYRSDGGASSANDSSGHRGRRRWGGSEGSDHYTASQRPLNPEYDVDDDEPMSKRARRLTPAGDEPCSSQVEALLAANPGLQIEDLRAALETGVAQLEAESTSTDGVRGPEHVSVPVITVSQAMRNLRLRQIDLLKLDCEGAELDVLLGLTPATWGMVNQIVAEVADVDGRLRVGCIVFWLLS